MSELKAVIFDQDGVLADTERDGHRVAFNSAFKEFGFDFEWDIEAYGKLLKVGGGKERIRYYLAQKGLDKQFPDFDETVAKIHKRKTDLFMEIIRKGLVSLRPGISRLIKEAHDMNIKLAVCSTSNEKAVNTLINTLLGKEVYGWFEQILAGDIVKNKKPDPEIYNMVQGRLGISPEECLVIEDSRNGLLAAKGAGMRCLVTINDYTKDENFDEADLVVTSLGEKEGPEAELISKDSNSNQSFPGYVTIDILKDFISKI